MRLHSEETHPDFHPAAYKAKVFLAGSERGSVVFADEEARHAIVYKLNERGSPIMDLKTGETVTEDFFGDVAIVFDDPAVAKQVEDDCKRRDAKIGGYCYAQGKGKKCEQRPYSARCTHCEEIMLGLADSVKLKFGPDTQVGVAADKLGAVGTVEIDATKPRHFTVTVDNRGIVGGISLAQQEAIRGEVLARGGIVGTIHDEVFVGANFQDGLPTLGQMKEAYKNGNALALRGVKEVQVQTGGDRHYGMVTFTRIDGATYKVVLKDDQTLGELLSAVEPKSSDRHPRWGSVDWARGEHPKIAPRFNPPTNQEILDAYKRGGTAAVVALPGCIKADILHGATFDQLTVERSWAPKLVMPIMRPTGGIVDYSKLEQRVLSHSPALSAGYGSATTGRTETPSYETITDVFKGLSESIKQCKKSMEDAIAAAPIRDRVKMSALAAKTVYGTQAVKNVFAEIGGAAKLADIPEDKLPAVLDILDRMHRNVTGFFFDEATPMKRLSPEKEAWLAGKDEKGLREQLCFETKRLCNYASRIKDTDKRRQFQTKLHRLVRDYTVSGDTDLSRVGTVAMLSYVALSVLPALLQKLRDQWAALNP